ncbi:MAG: InlB B-repeat-containing protein [Lachnospiraceae bacterium]|nr:InlB B-repeat-containing protein [Lachnospiraceae bacterium]
MRKRNDYDDISITGGIELLDCESERGRDGSFGSLRASRGNKEVKARKKQFLIMFLSVLLVLQLMPSKALAATTVVPQDDIKNNNLTSYEKDYNPGDIIKTTTTTGATISMAYTYQDPDGNEIKRDSVYKENYVSSGDIDYTIKNLNELNPEYNNAGLEKWSLTVQTTNHYDSAYWFENVTMKATFKTFNINYNLNGGTNDTANKPTYTYAEDFTFKPATKAHADFKGWYTDAGFTNQITAITKSNVGDLTLYAKFEGFKHNISYELDGGTNDSSNPAEYEEGVGVASFKDATKEGYTFDGWYKDAGFSEKVTSISDSETSDVTLYAKFTEITAAKHTITYVLDGGTNDTSNPTEYTEGTGVASFKDAKKDGYTFDGWYRDAGFTEKVTSIAGTETADVTLYAKFTKGSNDNPDNPGEGDNPDKPDNPGENDKPSKPDKPSGNGDSGNNKNKTAGSGSEEDENAGGSPHEHVYEWQIVKEATETEDGLKAYCCRECGHTLLTEPLTAYEVFVRNAAAKIKNAAPGAEVELSTTRFLSINKFVTEALTGRKDVTLKIRFLDGGYRGNAMYLTIPAGTDLAAKADEHGYCGFLYLGSIFGLTPVQ